MSAVFQSPLEMLVGQRAILEEGLPTEPILFSRPVEPFQRLLTFESLDDILVNMPLSAPFLELSTLKEKVPRQYFTYGPLASDPLLRDCVDPVAVSERLDEGATLLLNFIDRLVPRVGEFCRSLSRQLGTAITADAFLTPAESQGLNRHYDRVAAFVVQVEGAKTWQFYEPETVLPLSDYHYWNPATLSEADHSRIFEGPPALVFDLKPGNVLWVPRGWIHNVFSRDQPSLHLTFGVPDLTPHTLARTLVDMLADRSDLRVDLPPLFWRDHGSLRRLVKMTMRQIVAALEEEDIAEIGERLKSKVLSGMLPAGIRPVATAFGLRGTDTRVELRRDHVVAIEHTEDETTLHLGDREMTLTGVGKAAVDAVLSSGSPVIDAGDNPALRELVAALVQQGVAVPVAKAS